MPKKRRSDKQQTGTRLYGYSLFADGRPDTTPITLQPNSRAFIGVATYSTRAIQIIPDASGLYEAHVPPGEYEVTIGRDFRRTITIPAVAQVGLNDLLGDSIGD